MKILAVVACALFVFACEPQTPEQKERETVVRQQKWTERRLADITYFQDPRATEPLCYAHLWQVAHTDKGGPSLSVVPCKPIEHLLTNGPIK